MPASCPTAKNPVCGIYSSKMRRNFDNWCLACSTKSTVWGYYEGPCELQPVKPSFGASFAAEE